MAGALGDLKRVHHGRCTEVQIRGFCEAVTIYNGFAKWCDQELKKGGRGVACKKVLKLQYLGPLWNGAVSAELKEYHKS